MTALSSPPTRPVPLCVELYAGTFGWSAGWLALGGRAIGFDLEHEAWHGTIPDGAELVIQDVRTLHGAQFRDASLILGSSPCQEFSYRAMPWKRAKQLPPPELGMELFHAQFRIQREASEAAGRWIPMVVENVCGAQKWVGRARWHFGSYYLWGDVPALMPIVTRGVMKRGVAHRANGETNFHGSAQRALDEGVKGPTMGAGWYPPDHPKHVRGLGFNTHADRHQKNAGGSWFNVAHNTTSGHGQNPDGRLLGEGTKTVGHVNRRDGHSHARHLTNQAEHDAVKVAGFPGAASFDETGKSSSKSRARRAASAAIARIPDRLSQWIAECYWPADVEVEALTQGALGVGE